MTDTQTLDFKVLDLKKENIFEFKDGLPGFEKVKRFTILIDPQEAPFGRLTAIDFDLCFIVIDPWVANAQYKPNIDTDDVKQIDSPDKKELLILCIASIPENKPQEATVNLVAPLIVNVKKGLGKQVIIDNFTEYSAKHQLWQKEEEIKK